MSAYFSSIGLTVDTEGLKRDLALNAHLFGQYPQRGEGDSPHSEMTDIWARYNDVTPYIEKGSMEGFADEHESIWYPSAFHIPHLFPIVDEVVRKLGATELGGVLITKLPPGGKIRPHTDSGWHAKHYEKIYVPVKSAPGARFSFIDGNTIDGDEGKVYWFRNDIAHWVDNDSSEDKIAMIICIKRGH